jgi:hypothetical protein
MVSILFLQNNLSLFGIMFPLFLSSSCLFTLPPASSLFLPLSPSLLGPLSSVCRLWSGAYSSQEKYSQADVKQLVEYARARGVRVMIEFDMPGGWMNGLCSTLQ